MRSNLALILGWATALAFGGVEGFLVYRSLVRSGYVKTKRSKAIEAERRLIGRAPWRDGMGPTCVCGHRIDEHYDAQFETKRGFTSGPCDARGVWAGSCYCPAFQAPPAIYVRKGVEL